MMTRGLQKVVDFRSRCSISGCGVLLRLLSSNHDIGLYTIDRDRKRDSPGRVGLKLIDDSRSSPCFEHGVIL